jgi:hypothetical protein
MSNPYDLFIIHVSADERVALELAMTFEGLGYRAWVYQIDSRPPGDYVAKILRGIDAASVLLALMSANSLDRDKSEEVAREINYGEVCNKPFIPLILGLTDDDFTRRVPKTWQQAFGKSLHVRVDPDDVASAAHEIAEGLPGNGVHPTAADETRLAKLRQRMERLARRERVRARRRTVLAIVAAAVLLIGARQLWTSIGGMDHPEATAEAGIMTVWIVDPTLDGFGPTTTSGYEAAKAEYGILQRRLEIDLLRIAEEHQVEMQIVNDDEVETALVNAGCPDVGKKFQIPECAEQKAFDHLGIRAKVNPTFRGTGQKRDLTLRIGLGRGARRLPQHESLDDTNLTTLADWSAEQIALFLDIPRERIARALEPKRATVRLFEGALVEKPPPATNGSSRLPSLVGEAFAETPPDPAPTANDREIREVLEALRTAFETQDASKVEPIFDAMTPEQREAMQRYFDNVDDLQVAFIAPEITVDGDTARAAFLREDKFRDKLSGDETNIAVRVIAVLVRQNGAWKVESLAKPS